MLNNVIPHYKFSLFLPPFFSPAFKSSSYGICSGGDIVLVKCYMKKYVCEVQTDCPNCVNLIIVFFLMWHFHLPLFTMILNQKWNNYFWTILSIHFFKKYIQNNTIKVSSCFRHYSLFSGIKYLSKYKQLNKIYNVTNSRLF